MDTITDEELESLALAADPDVALDDDAVSLWELEHTDDDLLPAWYMPSPMVGVARLQGWKRTVVLLIIVSFLVIDAAGLCSTYGWVGFG